MKFLQLPRPVLTALFSGQSPTELIAKAANSEFDGAAAIAIELHDLRPEFRNTDALRSIINAVNLPMMFCFYRKDAWENRDDDARQQLLLQAADAGASVIDVMGDLYDPQPLELALAPAAIEKQRRLIDSIHAKGAAVVVSSHTQCFRSTEQVVEHLKTSEARGADIVKLVQTADTEDELLEAFRTTLALRRELRVPFIHLCNGKFARPHRFLCPALGTAVAFAVQRYDTFVGSQPTLSALRAALDNLHWNINSRSQQ